MQWNAAWRACRNSGRDYDWFFLPSWLRDTGLSGMLISDLRQLRAKCCASARSAPQAFLNNERMKAAAQHADTCALRQMEGGGLALSPPPFGTHRFCLLTSHVNAGGRPVSYASVNRNHRRGHVHLGPC